MRRIAEVICTVGFLGHVNAVPSTLFGSAVGIGIMTASYAIPSIQPFLILAVLFFGVWMSTVYAHATGRRDPQEIVVDETCGAMIAVFGAPVDLRTLALAYVAFHAFDVLKPPPIRYLQRLPDGWGVMLDDVAAGLCANAIVRLLVAVGLLRVAAIP